MRTKRSMWILAILVLVLPATAIGQTGFTVRQQQDRQAIEELHQKEIEANIAFDVDTMASLWTDDVVILPPNGPALQGREANLEFLRKAAEQIKDFDILSYSQDWRQVYQTDPDYAFEWGFISGRLMPAGGGKEISYRYQSLRILKRQPDGSWKIHRSIWNDAEAQPDQAGSGTTELQKQPSR